MSSAKAEPATSTPPPPVDAPSVPEPVAPPKPAPTPTPAPAPPKPLVFEPAPPFDPLKLEPTDISEYDEDPSVVDPSAEEPSAEEPESREVGKAWPFMFVVEGLVVLETKADAAWETGEPLTGPAVEGDYEAIALQRAETSKLPRKLQTRLGRRVDFYDENGKRCSGKIAQLHMAAFYVSGVDGIGLLDHPGEPTDAELREATWKTQPHWLVGALEHDGSPYGCDGLWARDASLPAPVILVATRESNEIRKARIEAFRSTPTAKQLFDAYQEYRREAFAADPERAVELDVNPYEFEVTTWIDRERVPKFVALRFAYDDLVVGNYEVFERVRGVEFVATDLWVEPLTVFDADLDGEFELLFEGNSTSPPDIESWYAETTLVSETLGRKLSVNQDAGCAN